MSYPIADMLTRIRNAQMARKSEAILPYSKMKAEMCRILKENDYIDDFRISDDVAVKNKKNLVIALKYIGRKEGVIHELKLVSRPGRRLYQNAQKLPVVLNHYGIAIISTSQGLMTNKEARKKRLGGEVICEVY